MKGDGVVRRDQVSVIDLFAGAGGLSIGAELGGAQTALAVELDEFACMTLRENAPTRTQVRRADLTQTSGPELREWAGLDPTDQLIVIGGPPCQAFSKAAYWLDEGSESQWRKAKAKGAAGARPDATSAVRPDERRSLVDHFARLVVESEADGFVFENVPSILHPRNRPVMDALVGTLESAGFQTAMTRALASNFGVAQHRERVFLLGSRISTPAVPLPTHDGRSLGALGLLPAVSCREALRSLEGTDLAEPEVEVRGRWKHLLDEVPPGWNYKFHTSWAGHPSPSFEAERRYWNFLLVLDPDKPSWTIPASPGPWVGPFHWDHRRLTSSEMAALQGFPSGYRFSGGRRERVRQIGNAVPPPMAAPMVRSVMRTLRSNADPCVV